MILFKRCQECGSQLNTKKFFKVCSMLCIKSKCSNSTCKPQRWTSQPNLKKQPIGNVALTASLYMSGISYTSFHRFFDTANIKFLSNRTYYTLVRSFLFPVIKLAWLKEREEILNELQSSDDRLMVCGDAQYDSPGHCAKLCICSIQNLKDKKIIDFFLHQKGIEPGDLENDRHRGVAKMVRENFPEIFHSYDIWHLCKSLSKKLTRAALKYPLIGKWRDSILLHLWYSRANCNENPDNLEELFLSLLNHIQNKHSWTGGQYVNRCKHARLRRRDKNKMWLNNHASKPENNTDAEFAELSKILKNKSFLTDLRHAVLFFHTGDLESYHNERLTLLPKRSSYTYDGTMMLSTLVVIDYNYNVGRKKTVTRLMWSKACKKYVVKNVYERNSNHWRKVLCQSTYMCGL
ncbi:hypothetical protein B566_EDAN007004 [Ephemera danica]|nr:hypothetical protein B566_EDAN007004 [Ephemera danica]